MQDADLTEKDHPSTLRKSTSIPALIFGLTAAPIAWTSAQLVSFEVAQRACYPKTMPLNVTAIGGVHLVQTALLGAALLISIGGILVAATAWRQTKDEHGGDGHTLLAIGEGRSRFMAFAGILTSAGFLLAILFSAPAVFAVPAC
jgi:hypothetical protein